MEINFPTQKDRITFDTEINRLLEKLNSLDPKEEEYGKVLKNLEILTQARAQKSSNQISMDTVLSITANLLGIMMILNFERAGIVTSKAIGFVFKGR